MDLKSVGASLRKAVAPEIRKLRDAVSGQGGGVMTLNEVRALITAAMDDGAWVEMWPGSLDYDETAMTLGVDGHIDLRKIKAALDASYRKGLEEAALLVDGWGEGYFSRDRGEDLAAAIRALAKPTLPEDAGNQD